VAANIYGSLTKFDKAAWAYETFASRSPRHGRVFVRASGCLPVANKFDDAVKVYNRAENALGISEVSSVQKMRILIEQGKLKEGIAEGEKTDWRFSWRGKVCYGFRGNSFPKRISQ
jgi:hypothetical protein